MVHEILHREKALTTGRAPWRNHSIPALRHGWWMIHEGVESMAANLIALNIRHTLPRIYESAGC
jgi:hypothetical protein